MISYLRIDNLSKSFGDLVLFKDICFHLDQGQKIGLIAKNGTGKSTLLNIISGKDSPSSGTISFHKDISIGFLEQDPQLNHNLTVIEQSLASDNPIVKIIKDYEAALTSNSEKDIQRSMELMDLNKAWDYENKVKQILSKLKLNNLDQKVSSLSGGQQKRLALANVLINNPDLLILDEPTNHLDIEMIEWLEEYLADTASTLLLVTHDRYFLDDVCNGIIEIDRQGLYHYKGSYEYYIEKRDERIANDLTNIDKARNLMVKELEWIRRMPKARGTKSKYRIEAFDELKKKASEKITDDKAVIRTNMARLGSKIIELESISKAYQDKVLIQNFSYIFSRGEKLGIVGNNGSGKSTFLNILTGNVIPDSGTVSLGETLVIGYFRQEGMQFDQQMRVIDAVTNIAEFITLADGSKISASGLLTLFLFPPEKQYSYIYKLSGGEKRRLFLVTILMNNPNFLILDEPTNDLDIPTLQVLEDYLVRFGGCVIVVSHDRFFLDKIVQHIFAFDGNGVIKDFPGNYTEYRIRKQLLALAPTEKKVQKSESKLSSSSNSKKAGYKEKRAFEVLGNEIKKLEVDKEEIEFQLSQTIIDHQMLSDLSLKHAAIVAELDKKTDEWLHLDELLN